MAADRTTHGADCASDYTELGTGTTVVSMRAFSLCAKARPASADGGAPSSPVATAPCASAASISDGSGTPRWRAK